MQSQRLTHDAKYRKFDRLAYADRRHRRRVPGRRQLRRAPARRPRRPDGAPRRRSRCAAADAAVDKDGDPRRIAMTTPMCIATAPRHPLLAARAMPGHPVPLPLPSSRRLPATRPRPSRGCGACSDTGPEPRSVGKTRIRFRIKLGGTPLAGPGGCDRGHVTVSDHPHQRGGGVTAPGPPPGPGPTGGSPGGGVDPLASFAAAASRERLWRRRAAVPSDPRALG